MWLRESNLIRWPRFGLNSLPDKLNLVPAISFSCDRRTGAREGLAERVEFRAHVTIPVH